MNHFLLTFERMSGRLQIQRFEGADAGQTALRARFVAEAKFAGQPDVEVVVIQAESENAIRRTHSRYFQSVGELAHAARADLASRAS